jgi:hypothetical protein
MSGGLFLLPYTPSWHGKRQIFFTWNNFPPCFHVLPCNLLPHCWRAPHFYTMVWKGALQGQNKSWPIVYIFSQLDSSTGPTTTHRWGFEITPRHTSLGTNPLDEWSARHRDLCLTVHKNHNRQTSKSSRRFEPAIPASERPQFRALRREVTGIGIPSNWYI